MTFHKSWSQGNSASQNCALRQDSGLFPLSNIIKRFIVASKYIQETNNPFWFVENKKRAIVAMSRLFFLLAIVQLLVASSKVSAQTFAERVHKAYQQKVKDEAFDQVSARKGGKGMTLNGSGGKGMGAGKGMMMMMKSRKTPSPSPISTISLFPTPTTLSPSSSPLSPTDLPTFSPTLSQTTFIPTASLVPTTTAFPTESTLFPTPGKSKKGMMMMSSKMGKGMSKGKMMGKGGGKKSKKTPEPTFTPFPTNSPAPTFINEGCIPTVGPCISTADDLANTFESLTAGDVVALCGSGKNIEVDRALRLDTDGATLCCGSADCFLLGTGNDAILHVSGDSVTIANVTFLNGASSASGGNVAVTGGGSISIISSSFRNGVTERSGGNLFVRTSGSVLIDGTSFVTGTAGDVGGGLAIEQASAVVIVDSIFIGNVATEGGGFATTYKGSRGRPGQAVTIDGSFFLGNAADVGGGLLASDLGHLPELVIMNTEFSGNTATSAAGAGAIVDFLDNLELTLKNNNGNGNVGVVLCTDFLTAASQSSDSPICIATTEDFSG
jgi:hypothetical protein